MKKQFEYKQKHKHEDMKLKYKMGVQHILDFWAAVPVGEDAKRYSGVMSLNETAKDMIEMLNDEITEDEMVSRLLAEYDVTEEELRPHVRELLDKLRAENLLVE